MWTLFEPIHAVTYFAPEARSAFEQAGLRGFWRGYFAGRAAPLGPVGAAVVGASFFNFAPAFVGRAIPGVWQLISPEQALRTRLSGAVDALGGLLAGREAQVTAAADLLWRTAGELDCAGRVLAAANVALLAFEDRWPDPPGSPDSQGSPGSPGLARLWQAATVLREHRGDGHFAALAAADIDGCEAVVLRCGLDLRREDMQPIRGWTDEQWAGAHARLAGRGWVEPGRRAHQRGPAGARRRDDDPGLPAGDAAPRACPAGPQSRRRPLVHGLADDRGPQRAPADQRGVERRGAPAGGGAEHAGAAGSRRLAGAG
jgi:hypothetical protein